MAGTSDTLDDSHSYGYDPRNRLTSDLPGGVDDPNTWDYNAATQLTEHVVAGNPQTTNTLDYDQAGELQSLTALQGLTITQHLTFTYNLDGDRTQRKDSNGLSTTNYGYDAAGRLTGTGVWSYSYDGDGLRQSKTTTAGKGASSYTWDVNGGLPQLLQDSTGQYLYGPGGMLAEEIQGSTVYYVHTDQLGSVRALSDKNHGLVATYTYDPYGTLLASTGTTTPNPFGWAGQYQDAETGFYYLRARYYDPATMQFLTPDPLDKLGGMQRPYAYAEGESDQRGGSERSGRLRVERGVRRWWWRRCWPGSPGNGRRQHPGVDGRLGAGRTVGVRAHASRPTSCRDQHLDPTTRCQPGLLLQHQ